MKKRLFLIPLAIILVAGLILGGCTQPAEEPVKPMVLNYNTWVPPTTPRFPEVVLPFFDRITEESGGAITFNMNYNSALAPPPQTLDAVINRVADISEVTGIFMPGRLPYNNMVFITPGLAQKTVAETNRAWWHIYQKYPEVQDEWQDVKVLFFCAVPPFYLVTKEPVSSLEDIAGMKVHCQGQHAKAVQALGQVPVTGGIGPEAYLTLEKGVADAGWEALSTLIEWKLAEVTNYYIEGFNLPGLVIGVCMNRDAYNELPDNIQKLIDESSEDLMEQFIAMKDQATYDMIAAAEAEFGMQKITLSPEEVARWEAAVAPVTEEILNELEGEGLKAREVYNEWLEFAKTLE